MKDPAGAPGGAARILIVEDEALVAQLLRRLLALLGYEVVASSDTGEEALRIAGAAPIDLALMDIQLKGEMSGIETALRLREEYEIPVVFITAYADPETIVRVAETAPYGYLVKPFDDRTLSSTLETALVRSGLERQVREQERFLRATLMAVSDGVVSADADDRAQLMNPVAEALTGWSEAEARGRLLAEILRLEEPEAGGDVLAEVLERSHRDDARILVRRDGRRLPVAMQARVYGDAARSGGRVVVLRDLTMRLATEESLRRSERLSATGHLLWGFAHEARNPLFGLSATLDLIEDELEPGSAFAEPVTRLRAGVDRLVRLTRRIEEHVHASPALPETLSPCDLVEAARRSCAAASDEAGVRVEVELSGDLPAVRGHEGPLVQMLAQLILNAVRHSAAGGTVWVRGRLRDDDEMPLLLEVSDRGPGFAGEDLERAFEPFFSRSGRTGLGLTQVRRIAEEHGGRASAANGADGGACVSVALPVQREPPDP